MKRIDYNINIDIKTGYENGEVVSLGESELIRIINRLKNKEINHQIIKDLISQKRNLKKLKDSKENSKEIIELDCQLEELLFIPEIANVEFDDPRHYKAIVKNGLFINGKKFIRLLTGAGMARRSTVQFVEEEFSKELKRIINNNRNPNMKLVDSKFNAYYALVSSASYPVTFPRFCVIKDYKYTKERLVDFVVETEGDDEDDYVEERIMPIEQIPFDGQGLISLEFAKQWSIDLDLNYVPNSFCIRGSYLKGQCVAFDFKRFSNDVAHSYFITDVWGDKVDIREVDVILTTSQLKLWNSYSSHQDYIDACHKNEIGWSVSRFTPRKEKDYFRSSYQLLQVLDLDKKQIENLCKPTIDWLRDVSTRNVNKSLLYLIGSIADNEDIKDGWFDSLENWNLKAVLLNHDLFNDSYFKRTVYRTLNKKIREARMGKLLFPGNWQVCISDPYAFCEYIFGSEPKGLLAENQHYSQYWLNKNIDIVASGRSPLTWKSEMNLLHLKNNKDIVKWFGHIHSGIIFNIHGVDTMLMADSDFDYDITFSTSQEEFIKGASGGKPVTYEKKLPPKNIIDEDKLYLADINTMGSKIGWITNLGTTLYALLPLFEKESQEYKEVIKRLIIIRKSQGNEIDRGKGILVKSLPQWNKWNPPDDNFTVEEEMLRQLKNKLVINRRPKFMIYLYPDYMRKFKNHRDIYQNYCESLYGYNLEDLISKKNKTEYETELYTKYQEFNPFIDSKSIMGIICNYMEDSLEEIKMQLKDGEDFDIDSLINKDIPIDENKIKKMKDLYRKFNAIKKGIYYFDDNNESIGYKFSKLNELAYESISSNNSELANLAVTLCYKEYKSIGNRDFCWKIFGEEIISNLIGNYFDYIEIPLKDDMGDIYYLDKRYSIKRVKINKN